MILLHQLECTYIICLMYPRILRISDLMIYIKMKRPSCTRHGKLVSRSLGETYANKITVEAFDLIKQHTMPLLRRRVQIRIPKWLISPFFNVHNSQYISLRYFMEKRFLYVDALLFSSPVHAVECTGTGEMCNMHECELIEILCMVQIYK